MEVVHGGYPLRPEIVESTYYLFQYTKDEKYLQMGKTFFDDFVKYCKTEVGYAGLKSVVTKEKSDSMQSFLFAETFKYYYLLFAPPNTLDFKKVVFNTEAHPIKKTMKKIEELNKSKLPIVKIDKSLDKYKDKVLFKEKVDKANETLKSVGLPKELQKSKA